jgi:hypothetical protein
MTLFPLLLAVVPGLLFGSDASGGPQAGAVNAPAFTVPVAGTPSVRPMCPQCGAPLVTRTDSATQGKLFVCSRSPLCQGALPFTTSPPAAAMSLQRRPRGRFPGRRPGEEQERGAFPDRDRDGPGTHPAAVLRLLGKAPCVGGACDARQLQGAAQKG